MRKIILMLAIGIGYWQWSDGNITFLSSSPEAFDETGNPIVKVITVAGCGAPCKQAVNELKRRRVDFEKVQINPEDEENEDVKLWKKVGRNMFPLIVSGDETINGSGNQPQIATLLGLNYEDKYLSSTEKRYYKNHFNLDGSPQIVVYGTSWCPDTRRLREELQASNVDFIEIDVERNSDQDRLLRTMGIGGYPATWVGYTRVKDTKLSSVQTVLKNY